MASKSNREPDLTSTIHLTNLRAVKDPAAKLLESLDSQTRRVIKELPSGSGMLIALTGPGRGARYLLDREESSIGRATSSDIFLDDVTVSRAHALVRRNEVGFEVEDLGSLNGTYLDGVLVTRAALQDGAELQIGKFRVSFFNGGKR